MIHDSKVFRQFRNSVSRIEADRASLFGSVIEMEGCCLLECNLEGVPARRILASSKVLFCV